MTYRWNYTTQQSGLVTPYIKCTLPSGVSPRDNCWKFENGAEEALTKEGKLQTEDALKLCFERQSLNEIKISVNVDALNPWIIEPPIVRHDITVRVNVHLRKINDAIEYKLSGWHDVYPWHEIFVKKNPIYKFDACFANTNAEFLLGPPLFPVEELDTEWKPLGTTTKRPLTQY